MVGVCLIGFSNCSMCCGIVETDMMDPFDNNLMDLILFGSLCIFAVAVIPFVFSKWFKDL